MYSTSRFIDSPSADKYAEEGLQIFRDEINDRWGLSLAYQNMAIVAGNRGDRMEKEKYLAELKKLIRETPLSFQSGLFYLGITNLLESFGFLAITEEEPERAARLLGAAEALREEVQSPLTDFEQIEYSRSLGRLRSMPSEGELQSSWAEGRSMTMEQAIQFALIRSTNPGGRESS